ncbi:hypothetical protein [Paracoccus sp. JM45]|jgi:hypothetical protein|uniref:hypothetical protein n=1 Tax=Paracoccus sp. JM45 TaxID=2283626 RepID=UPI000E6BCC71|nr:hypothetical protein [Paracoccus sp. JM45]RJE78999.1 hypothetical protein DWB67_14635 [Paracoccus sp. JM45]
MKTIMIALTVLAMATGVAGAATDTRNERPDVISTASAADTMRIRADLVMSTVELTRAGIAADTMITSFPTNTTTAYNNQDR